MDAHTTPLHARSSRPARRCPGASTLAAVFVSLLASCGGGADAPRGAEASNDIARAAAVTSTASPVADTGTGIRSERTAPASSAGTEADARRKINAVFVPTTPVPADAATRGMWSPVTPWPLVAVHAVLMPDGRVLSYGTDGAGNQTGHAIVDVWDPEGGLAGGHLTLPNTTQTDLFCSSQLVLPSSGAVFIAGGDNWTGSNTTNTGNNNSNLFTPASNTLARGVNMNRPRWYSSSITLTNGETYIQGGSGGTDRPEVRSAAGTFRLLSNVDTSGFAFQFPRNFVAPDGRVFGYESGGRMYYVDPSAANGTGALTAAGAFNSAYAGDDASAAMFSPGRILQFGGNSNGAAVIDIRGGAPVFTPTQPMSSQRRLVNATLLANGRVLATGGSANWNELVGVNTYAEIWNPDTGTWTLGAAAVQARLYHSTTLLLPDATVLSAGGGAPGPQNNLNVELYYPPYLFKADGTLAARPTLTAAPSVLDIGKTFRIAAGAGASGAVPSRVVLIKTGSTSHSFNMEQRFVELTSNAAGNGELLVQTPTRAADAPPGFYLLFVLDAAGVPSVGKLLRVNVAATPNPAVTPALANPGDRSGTAGSPASLALVASDPNGDALAYTASGLPPGLSIDPASGRISGTPQVGGRYSVVVVASDGVNSANANFVWTVAGGNPLAVGVPAPPAPLRSGLQANFTAAASNAGANVRYRWDYGDGDPPSDWSNAPTTNHAYSQPGLYYVTVTATDDRGVEARQTVLQAVYLAATAQRPTQSSSIVVEPRGGGANPRVWVVNPDNDSVTVFDGTTRARLAEITVGEEPRSVAVAPNGLLWVTNKRGASVSVIDANTLKVTRTLALPRGAQPHGIAMAAASNSALVALEATGQLVKISTTGYNVVSTLAVGGSARHVSVSGDGATAWVSRFITPPLPGEATAQVVTTNAGGVLVAVSINGAGSAMAVARSVLLAHGDRPDAENQGRGIPNYLGALALSPDGTQGFVPSKLDNIKRGTLRDGLALNFQNTVRAVTSRVVLTGSGAYAEDPAARVDHDNASGASAALFDANGSFLFVALPGAREVAVLDAFGRRELLRIDSGRAPQGLALSPDGKTLYVDNFMDRSVGVFDLTPLAAQGRLAVPALATLPAIGTEKLPANVLKGKQFFYDARDTRLARDRYMSCASCHDDGGQDGRVWDFSAQGEGLRNTIALRGRGGMGQGFLHWSGNFDEVQDFETQIRALAGGTGLMSDTAFNASARNQPLGATKAGLSADLDALAAYVASLLAFDPSPYRPSAVSVSSAAADGRNLFVAMNCAACHGGNAYTRSGAATLFDIGTLTPASGQRLYGPLTGIDPPTLRDVWATAPYLHDGSAPTLEAAIQAHDDVGASASDATRIAAYLRELGADEAAAPQPTGTGLAGSYYNNTGLSGWWPTLTRTEAVDFDWGSGGPGGGVRSDYFSVRWTGSVVATASGAYRFQTVSDDGVRVWVNGALVINNWTTHAPTTDTAAPITLAAGQKVSIKIEYFENDGGSTVRLRWQTPSNGGFATVPRSSLFPN